MRPGVGVRAAGTPKFFHRGGVHDAEVQAELVPHLIAPLQGEAGRADDQHGACPVPQDQLLHDQAGLDRLAEAHVVGDEQVRPRHGQRPDHRVELVVIDLDAGPERGLEHGLVGRGNRTPADRVKESVELARLVEPGGRVGQHVLIVGDRAALQLPDDAQLLVAGVVLDADQGDGVLRAAGHGLRGDGAPGHVGDDPDPVADGDELTLRRGAARFRCLFGCCRHFALRPTTPFILPHSLACPSRQGATGPRARDLARCLGRTASAPCPPAASRSAPGRRHVAVGEHRVATDTVHPRADARVLREPLPGAEC